MVDRLEPIRMFGGSLWSRQAPNSSYSPLDDPGKKNFVAPPEVPRLLYIIL